MILSASTLSSSSAEFVLLASRAWFRFRRIQRVSQNFPLRRQRQHQHDYYYRSSNSSCSHYPLNNHSIGFRYFNQYYSSSPYPVGAATCAIATVAAAGLCMIAGRSALMKKDANDSGNYCYCLEQEENKEDSRHHGMLHPFDETQFPTGYTEQERFLQALEYHRSLLYDYVRRWDLDDKSNLNKNNNMNQSGLVHDNNNHQNSKSSMMGRRDSHHSSSTAWPRNIPFGRDISALELDLQYCMKGCNNQQQEFVPHQQALSLLRICQNLQFRIATYYLAQTNNLPAQLHGFKQIKKLAEQGHPDGMCLCAMILMDGRIPTVPRKPEQAVRLLRKASDFPHRHITAMYELGIAYYVGIGVEAEDPKKSVQLFQQAAHLGHAGAAYMLGECLLDGVGCKERDRAAALEWLLTAAELGHSLARERAINVLLDDCELLTMPSDSDIELGRRAEARKWMEGRNEDVVLNLERRYSYGGMSGGSDRSPKTHDAEKQERRKSKVTESRDVDNSSQY